MNVIWLVAIVSALAAPQIPEKFTNLQVLPKDTQRPALVATMRSYALGLGVRCQYCHVGEGDDLSKFDFAADTKPTKAVARKMMKMADVINSDSLKGVGEKSETPKVTCYTCHRGAAKPLTAPPAGRGGH